MRRILLLLLAALPALAAAQDKPEATLLGAGVRSRPKFDGSADRTVDLIPMIRYFGKTWFARTTQDMLEGGARWNVRPGLDVGAQLAYEPGPLDHDPDASIGVHVEGDHNFGPVPANGLLRLRQHLRSDRGLELDARANVGVYRGHGFIAGLYGQATWANEKHFESYYDVRESGLLTTRLGVFGAYDLAPRWVLFASIDQRRLSDNAMTSPIVQRRSGTYVSVSLAYRFSQ
jgi:outer membrane scaffolding protein for murein synthesis (MipA/OmpV family)